MTARDAQLPTPDTLSLLLASQGITAPEAQAAVHAGLQVLQDFLHTFNARDANAWAHVLNYPHVRFAGEQVTVWDNALDYAASNDLARQQEEVNSRVRSMTMDGDFLDSMMDLGDSTAMTEVMQDPEIIDAISRNDYDFLMNNEKMKSLMDSQEIKSLLGDVQP